MKMTEQQKAIELREKGWSIKDIAKELGVAKSSVSRWVRSITLSDETIKRIQQNGRDKLGTVHYIKIGNTLIQKWSLLRDQYRQEGYDRAGRDEAFRAICLLYWGEGSKDRTVFSIANCDPRLLRIVWEWLGDEGYDDKRVFTAQYFTESGITEEDIKDYWKTQLPGLQEKHFRKFSVNNISRASQQKHIGKQKWGTGHVRVCHVRLVQAIYGGIEYISARGADGGAKPLQD